MPNTSSGADPEASDRISRILLAEARTQSPQRLTNFRNETQRLESIYQQKLAALEELKKSLLHQAFSGAL